MTNTTNEGALVAEMARYFLGRKASRAEIIASITALTAAMGAGPEITARVAKATIQQVFAACKTLSWAGVGC